MTSWGACLTDCLCGCRDTDGDGGLSDKEFRDGLFKFGVELMESDLDLVSMYINEEGTGGEL